MPNITSSPDYTDEGRLHIKVNELNIGRPAPYATIQIVDPNSGKVLEELVTDISGQTPDITVGTPPLEYSMGSVNRKPYGEYSINVTLDGFNTSTIHGVQVLPNSTAMQEVNLTPFAAGIEQEIFIPDHTLWGNFPPKISENPIKPLPEATGFVVLPEPVIPEFIIVHAGTPTNASAPNYWIPFIDYIKNVASSEIYPTWPEQTLIANVHAIISFTLNRVFTEWYRGQGHNFTITNSTQYDMAFTYGRNVFDEISHVVDNIFSLYITTPNIRQPLFTQFCDGQRVKCPNWMSQWGSKERGANGYLSMEILKHYYGHDIYLMQAQKVAGVPMSFPGTALQVGSTGNNVRMIQEQLNRISDNYPLIPKLRVDGIFGQATLGAVQLFQSIFNLPQTGIIDFATWYRISHVYVAVTRMAEAR